MHAVLDSTHDYDFCPDCVDFRKSYVLHECEQFVFVQIAAFSFGPRATHPIVLGGQFCAAVFFLLMKSLRTLGAGYILWCGTASCIAVRVDAFLSVGKGAFDI